MIISTDIANSSIRALKGAVVATVGMALLYPLFLRSAYATVYLLETGSTRASSAGLIFTYFVAMGASFCVPVTAALMAWELGRLPMPTVSSRRWLRLSHLAFAAPPLYTLIGVLTYIAGVGDLDFPVWFLLWGTILIVVLRSPVDVSRVEVLEARSPLRRFHGVAALTVLWTFLLAHLANHLFALWTPELHGQVMKLLELFYRRNLVEPLLVVTVSLLIASGLSMAWRYTAAPQDGFRALQTLTGVYVAVFAASHLTAVFVMARWLEHIPTDWAFASGAPAGLIKDPWNVRLIPHYSIAVWAVLTHVGLGVRGVLCAHGRTPRAGNWAAIIMFGLGAILSALITAALLGVHLGAA
jgi:hypothetical protein